MAGGVLLQETALYKLRSLQQELGGCVPCCELDKVNAQCQQLAVKYEHLLNQQNAYTASTANVDQLKVCCSRYTYLGARVQSEFLFLMDE